MTMEKILGNFLTQANKDFPLDCETLDYIQKLAALAALAGNIAGDRVVLYGCEANADGTHRGAGFVFVRTRSQSEGEVLPWDGGPTTGGMYVKQEAITVSANNTDYPKAYTRRSLAPGIGDENYSWDDFTDIKTIKELMAENRDLRSELAMVEPSPLGSVVMWAGANVPERYVLCDGRALRVAEFPELAAALGTVFNSAVSAGGTRYTTEPGFFRVPDLRGRFVVGRSDTEPDYLESGSAGGKRSVALAVEQMPAHSHMLKDFIMIPKGSGECGAGEWGVGGESLQAGYDQVWNNPKRCDTASDNRGYIQWLRHGTDNAGSGEAHENRPPYYVLAYIMRAK